MRVLSDHCRICIFFYYIIIHFVEYLYTHVNVLLKSVSCKEGNKMFPNPQIYIIRASLLQNKIPGKRKSF